ncbi:type VI secretion system tip protein TssI/VgrG [Sorangium sp. So ce1036]|uniref:type VI secretion system Vgr family protein n=1 Tax=Sorangium sp. So ce1036 TaxID=3133328 RepID=UPI003F022489
MTFQASLSADVRLPGRTDPSDTPYLFSAFPFPPGHFRVHAIRGREALSKPYSFQITVTSRALVGEDLERLALGQRAVLVLRVGGPARVIPGVVAAVRSQGVRPHHDAAQYTFRLVPAIALLRHQRGSRIFQNQRVDQVVDHVLRGASMSTRWELTREYPVRAYITQYEESDLAFVSRLLAEAGIFYRFAAPAASVEAFVHTAVAALAAPAPAADVAAFVQAAAVGIVYPEETIVFGDDASTYPAIASDGLHGAVEGAAAALDLPTQASLGPVTVGLGAPPLVYLSTLGLVTERANKVTAFEGVRRVRSDVAEYREYDPERPNATLVSRDEDEEPASGVLDQAAAALRRLVSRRALETYEHDGHFLFPDWKDVDEVARRIRRQTSRKRMSAEGQSLCAALAPGHRFRLEEHPIGAFNREHVVTSVEHRGSVASEEETYANAFTCVPAGVTYVPRRPRRRTVQALITATVVGPAGEDVHVDALGRVKVLFHWDRRRTKDDTASCWIRAVQPWAGAGFGHQFFPRVGMEVAVAFEGGDPDKPVVIGALYHATQPPPFLLPASKTQSGIRTQSIPGGRGYNEISFEDAAGKERIHIHAQADLDEVVRRDHAMTVHADERLRVMGSRQDTVVKNAATEVLGDREDIVRGDASLQHLGARRDVVQKGLDQRVGVVRAIRVDGRDDLEVRGAAEQRYLGDLTTRVTGHHTVIVGKHDAKRAMTLRVEGVASISADDGMELTAGGGITLRCGSSSIRIGEDGIELHGPVVRVAGEKGSVEASKEGITISSDGAYAHFGDRVLVRTEKARLAMGVEVKVDGERILLNSPEHATEAPPAERAPPTEIALVDGEGRPLGQQRFLILLEDGSQRMGVTDKDGRARIDLPAGVKAKIRFPELTELSHA